MSSKYQRQLVSLNTEIRQTARVEHKDKLLSKLRKRKIITHYMNQCDKKIESLFDKQYALEQLNITAMQIQALKNTTTVMKRFAKTYDIEKLEKLQDDMQELHAEIMDIDETLQVDLLNIDEAELEEELRELQKMPVNPMSTVSFPEVPKHIEKVPLLSV